MAKTKDIVDFDVDALFNAMDDQRKSRGLSWSGVVREIWEMGSELNRRRPHDHPLSASTITGMPRRKNTTCQHALIFLGWLGRSPESFLPGFGAEQLRGKELPPNRSDRRLRWDLVLLYNALNVRREEDRLTWADLARILGCTPNQLTGLRTARYATNMKLAMRIVQYLERPAADFIYQAQW